MLRRTFLAGATALASLLLVGCGPSWRVIVAATPNPLYLKGTFALLPIDYSGLHVGGKTEAEYLSEKKDTTRESWAGDKGAINEEFAASIMAQGGKEGLTVLPGPGPAPFQIRPRVQHIEPGFYVGVASGASAVTMDLMITTPDGKLVDHVEIISQSSDYSTGGRLRQDGKALGKSAAKYLAVRVAGH